MLTAVENLIPVFAIIALGAVLKRIGLIAEEQWRGVENLVYYICFPALIVYTLTRTDFSTVPVFALAVAMAATVAVVAAAETAATAGRAARMEPTPSLGSQAARAARVATERTTRLPGEDMTVKALVTGSADLGGPVHVATELALADSAGVDLGAPLRTAVTAT